MLFVVALDNTQHCDLCVETLSGVVLIWLLTNTKPELQHCTMNENIQLHPFADCFMSLSWVFVFHDQTHKRFAPLLVNIFNSKSLFCWNTKYIYIYNIYITRERERVRVCVYKENWLFLFDKTHEFSSW